MKKTAKKLAALTLTLIFLLALMPGGVPSAAAIEDDISISGANYPTKLTRGQSFSIKGTVTSDESDLSQVKVSISATSITYNDNGSVGDFSYRDWLAFPNAKTYNIHNLDSQIKFGELPIGTYIYKIEAQNACVQNKVLLEKPFTVTCSPNNPSNLAISGAVYPAGMLTPGQSFGIEGVISSNFPLTNVNCKVYNSAGAVELSYSKNINDSYTKSYNIRTDGMNSAIKFGNLAVGSYSYVVSATDFSGTSKTLVTSDFNVGYYPVAPSAPAVSVSGSTVTLAWNDVENEAGYDAYLLQEPWGWPDIRYSASVGANVTTATFQNVADGYYKAFIISRPNGDQVQSGWTEFTVRTSACLDVSAYVDGAYCEGISGIGLFDMYINGAPVAYGWGDYYEQFPVGTGYELKNIRPENGYSYDGIAAGTRVGTVSGDSAVTSVVLSFHTVSSAAPTPAASGAFGGSAYYYVSTPVTWYEAKTLCENMGGHLATVGSETENAYLYALAPDAQPWLGGMDRDAEGEWYWLTGEPFSYTCWATAQPDNCGGPAEDGEDYLHFSLAGPGNWNDNVSSALLPFICEIEVAPSTVSYDANGGSGAPAAQTKIYGETLTLSNTVPVREGYSFLGWAESADAPAQYQPGGSFTADADTVLYAVWQQQAALSITRQPESYAGPLGSTAAFTVEAAGDGLTYQWWVKTAAGTRFNKSSITGAIYSVTLTSARNGNQVYCVVTDAYGRTVQTDTVTMTAAAELAIVAQPADYTGPAGSTATFTVEAAGDGLSYQWYVKNRTARKFSKSSITAATYSVTLTETNAGRQLYCMVTDAYGNTVQTDTVTMTVAQPLNIVTQPVDYYGPAGSTATFTVEAAGDGLSYQWYVKNRTATRFSKSSITAATYSVTLTETNEGRQLYCVVTDAYGNTEQTDTVSMSIAAPALAILRQPSDYTGPAGSTATFSVVADGEELSYQWYVKKPSASKFSKSSITTATYSVELTAARNGNRLYCVVTDAYGNTVQTDTVTMTIEEEALAVPELTGATAGTNGITVTWNTVDGATTYRVYRKTGSGNWISLGDLTGLSYTDAAVLSGTTYTYTVKASNGAEWSGFDEIGVTATA